MLTTVWKFRIPTSGVIDEIPSVHRLLAVHAVGDELWLWAAVDPTATRTKRRLLVLGTGHDGHILDVFKHLGTVLMDGGRLVWHVFYQD